MNLEFQQISLRNFLSYGNQPVIVDLSKHSSTIIQAENGAGKTALIFDSIFFALYGSPLRDIKKHAIANFINSKDCVVELDMRVNSSDLKIIRGTKPDRFEVVVDGEEKWSDLKILEKQKELDQFIVVRKSVIEQIVFIGAKNVPFMKRTSANRKGFVEFILDLQVASRMNDIAKQKIKALKSKVSDNEFESTRVNEMLRTHNELLDSCRVPDQELIDENEKFITANESKLTKGVEKLNSIVEKVSKAHTLSREKKTIANDLQKEYDALYQSSKKGVCPTCGSDHTVDPKDLESIKVKIEEAESEYQEALNEYEAVITERDKLQPRIDEASQKLREKKQIVEREKSYSTDQAEELKNKIGASEEKIGELATEYEILNEDLSEYVIIQKSLQKGEAKSVIVEEFLPFINERVNGYLDQFGIPLLIEFDSEFNETFRSRYRDSASYENFSTGEQAIVDLSMLLTWRDLAENLTSVKTNLLVVDEYGNNLSPKNVQRQNDMIKSLKGVNFFGMTPKNDISDSFDHVISISKIQNFSVIHDD